MLGAIAKGVFGAKGAARGSYSEEQEVEELLNRVSEGGIADDRREALGQLRDVALDNPQAQLALGSMGVPVLLSVVRDERGDVELIRGAVECIHVCLAQPSSRRGAEEKGTPAWAINAEVFTRGRDSIPLLLGLLEEEGEPSGGGCGDFYVRYHTLRALCALMHAVPFKMQDAVMASGTGVSRISALLGDEEVLRNDALCLLGMLAASNEELKKMVAFEGVFDTAWSVVVSEGGVEGHGSVQDALDLVATLVEGSTKNQLMFRELGLVPKVAALLKSPLGKAAADDLSAQQSSNLVSALRLMHLLLVPGEEALVAAGSSASLAAATGQQQQGPGNGSAPAAGGGGGGQDPLAQQNRVANQALFLREGLMEPLLMTGISRATVSQVRGVALHCVAALVSWSRPGQDKLASLSVSAPMGQIPMLQAVLRVALYGADDTGRSAARQVLHSFCRGNQDGQLALASTLVPLGDDQDAISFGGELAKALVSHELSVCARAAAVAGFLLERNRDAKQRALTVPLSVHDAPGNYLMPRCVTYVQALLSSQGSKPGLALAAPDLLRFLFTWCLECPPAVSTFLSTSSHMPFLVDVIKGRVGAPHPVTCGLAALLLGACLLYQEASSSVPGAAAGGGNGGVMTYGHDALLDVITARVGLSDFIGRIEAMKEDPLWKEATQPAAALAHPGAGDHGAAPAPEVTNPLDADFVRQVAAFEPQLRSAVVDSHSAPRPPSAASGADGMSNPSGAGVGAGAAAGGSGSSSAAAAVTGATDGQRLASAMSIIQSLEREIQEVKTRNGALAQDVLRMSSPAGGTSLSTGMGQYAGPAAGGLAAASGGGGADPAAALAEAQLRVSQAEAEASRLQQEVVRLEGLLAKSSSQLDAARLEAETAGRDAVKHHCDLQDLSAAYNQLEQHTFGLEAQLQDAQQAAQAAQAREMQAEAAAAAAAAAAAPGGVDEDEVARRIEQAVEEALANAQVENEDGMGDLLVCLGQEEQKVERMRERLEELGQDVDALLEGIAADEEEEEEEQEEDQHGGEHSLA